MTIKTTTRKSTPKVGFVSLGCPKAGSDAERILTQLRAEGYEISGSYDEADLVVVNTCGFIDSAVEESLDAIGEAINKNGKVIVTGCLGAKAGVVDDRELSVGADRLEGGVSARGRGAIPRERLKAGELEDRFGFVRDPRP